jgi:hypothetical protein
MDLRLGMICPSCKKQNGFDGGCFGGPITQINYNCSCGFNAVMLVARSGYEIEYRAIKKESASNSVKQINTEISRDPCLGCPDTPNCLVSTPCDNKLEFLEKQQELENVGRNKL